MAANITLRKPPRIGGLKNIHNKELVPFTRQMSSMATAGMPLIESIMAIEATTRNPQFKKVIGYVRECVEGGSPLSSALEAFPRIFDHMYVNMVLAGEQSGQFDQIMRRLTVIIQNSSKLMKRIKSALTYPKVIISLSLLIAAGLVVGVVPQFGDMFAGAGKSLPALTQFLLDLANLIKNWWYVVIPGGIVLFILFKMWARTESGHFILDGLSLRLPVFGELQLKGAIARFTRLLGVMLNSGIPILKALSIVAGSLNNRVLEKSVMDAREEVEQGVPLNMALNGKPFMPEMMVRMIAAGEKSGRMQDMLDSVADTYDDEVEAMIAQLTALMEPMIMVLMGSIIGTIVIALFLPIFQLPSLAAS